MHRTNRTTTRRLILHTSLLVSLAVAVLFALGVTMAEVGAEKSPGSYQNAFTAACRNHGGTPKRVGTRVVKCTLGDGTVITCDFNFNPPSCTKALTPSGGGHNAGGGAAVDPSDVAAQPLDPDHPFAAPSDVAEQPLEPDGGGVTITAYDDGGTHDQTTSHGKRHRHGHGKGRKG
jgi:hypothetical protein